jgi:hypothetical protein
VGYMATSMIRPSNCALRSDWSLLTEAMSTVTVAAVAVVPSMVTVPETFVVRPTAVAFCPMSTSCTR